MEKKFNHALMSDDHNFCDNLLNFDNAFEPEGNNDVFLATETCPHCGQAVDLDQAYQGCGECLCPHCGTRFACE